MNKSIFADLYVEIDEALNNNSTATESISKIGPEINCYYNSVNVFVGRQGSGKTLQAITEIIKISRTSSITGAYSSQPAVRTHLLIYVSKYGTQSDKTFESMKHLINIPILYVKYEDKDDINKDSIQVFSKIQCYKRLYEQIKAEHLEDKIDDEQKQEIFDVLKINDFSAPTLHTLILFDDVANNPLIQASYGGGSSKNSSKGFFAQMLGVCRHIHCSFFLCVQFWKSITTEIKANVSTIYIFGLYSKQQLNVMLYQIPTHYSFDEIYNVYQELEKHDCLIVDANSGDIKKYVL